MIPLQLDTSINPEATELCVCVCIKTGFVWCVFLFYRGDSMIKCILMFASTLCKYDLMKGYLVVQSWARV